MNEIKRSEVGIAGAILVLSQALTSLHSSHTITTQIDKLRSELQTSNVDREQFFVRKSEVVSFGAKIDKLFEQISGLKEQVSIIQERVEQSYSLDECDPLIFDCKEVVSRD